MGDQGESCGWRLLGRRQGLEAVEDLLTVAEVVAVEAEVELDVGEAEDGDGTHLIEVRRAVERGFDGHGDLLLHLFGGP